MQKMTSTVLLIGCLILLIPLFSAEKCVICDYFVLVGEPTAISCPIITLPVLHSDYNLTWYKNGSATPVTTERDARIHQREGLLWFIPATLEDSGLYECDVRSLNHSNKKTINLTVFKNDNGLCFNEKMKFEQKVVSTNTGKIICPDLEHFKDEDNNQPEVHWYKECKPGFLEDKRLLLAEGENSVLIYNVTVQDRGNYTCRMVYTYMGKQYNVSRTISLEVKEGPLHMIPEFIYPKNNTIEVELEPMPASSKTDPMLAKAEPISDGGSASGITRLRRQKKPQTAQEKLQPERGVRICERNNSADIKVSEGGGGGGGAPGAGAEIPLQPVVKTMVRQAAPLQPMEVHGGADLLLQPVEDPTAEQVDA